VSLAMHSADRERMYVMTAMIAKLCCRVFPATTHDQGMEPGRA